MLLFNKLTLKIHCWGGLGSQLLALNYYLGVQEKFPGRRVFLVLHTGGITARNSEIDFLSNKINIIKVDDYRSTPNKGRILSSSPLSKLSLLKFFANLFRIVITEDANVSQVKLWTSSVRCTYTKNVLRKKNAIKLAQILEINLDDLQKNFLGVHYRLGDLPALKPGSLVSIQSISSILTELLKTYTKVRKIKVFSDTNLNDPSLQLSNLIDTEWRSVDTLQTIRELTQAKCFVGTNSKVSIWIAIFRWALDIPGDVYLPTSIISQFIELTNNDRTKSVTIKTYS